MCMCVCVCVSVCVNERGREGDEGGGVKGQRKRDRASPTSVASVNQVEVLKKFYFTVK